MHFSNDRVSVFLLPEPDIIETEFSIDIGTRYRDAILLDLPGGEAWVFDYGVIVFWGIDEDERLSLLHRLKFTGDILACEHQEHFRFTVEGSELKLQRDLITLGMDTPLAALVYQPCAGPVN